MAELVKIKGLKGKQNKKKWAKNIDVSGLLQAMEEQNNQQMRQTFAEPLIVEESTSNQRLPLDPNRFQSKGQSLPKTKYNNKPKATSILDEPIEMDPWNKSYNEKNPILSKYKKSSIPALVKPTSGLSYNPDQKAMTKLIENVIDYEGPKVKKTKQIKKAKQFKLQEVRHRNKNVRQQQLENRQRKANKQFAHELHSHRKVARQIDQKLKEIETKVQEKDEKAAKLQKQALTGRVRYGKKIGKVQYKYKEHIPSKQDLNKKISHVGGSQALVSDRFDSIYRRGIFEPRTIKVHRNKRKHIKVVEKIRQN